MSDSTVPTPPGPAGNLEPHRDSTVLIFGILSFVICLVFGILAWVLGSNDLKKMDAGIMDPAGRSNTKTGRILGMISTIISAAGIGIFLIIFIVTGGIFAAAATRF
jgi:hypothetical protein